MYILMLLIMVWAWTAHSHAATIGQSGGSAGGVSIATGIALPATCVPGTGPNALFLDTSDGQLYFCSSLNLLTGTSTGGFVPGESDTLETVKSRGATVTSANSLANAVRIGDGVTAMCHYTDATSGPVIKPCTDSNTRANILNGFTWGLHDVEGDADMLVVDPDATTKKAMYAFQPGYYPLTSFYVPARAMEGDGTQCPARPTVVTISNMAHATYVCTEHNSARMRFAVPMRNDWDGGVIYIKPYYAQTAADTGSVALEVAAACRALGTAFNGTYGTEVEVDAAAVVGSGAIESTLSAAVTPNGTCTSTDWLFVYIDVDATDNPTTAAATLNFLGADIFYSSTSLSH